MIKLGEKGAAGPRSTGPAGRPWRGHRGPRVQPAAVSSPETGRALTRLSLKCCSSVSSPSEETGTGRLAGPCRRDRGAGLLAGCGLLVWRRARDSAWPVGNRGGKGTVRDRWSPELSRSVVLEELPTRDQDCSLPNRKLNQTRLDASEGPSGERAQHTLSLSHGGSHSLRGEHYRMPADTSGSCGSRDPQSAPRTPGTAWGQRPRGRGERQRERRSHRTRGCVWVCAWGSVWGWGW